MASMLGSLITGAGLGALVTFSAAAAEAVRIGAGDKVLFFGDTTVHEDIGDGAQVTVMGGKLTVLGKTGNKVRLEADDIEIQGAGDFLVAETPGGFSATVTGYKPFIAAAGNVVFGHAGNDADIAGKTITGDKIGHRCKTHSIFATQIDHIETECALNIGSSLSSRIVGDFVYATAGTGIDVSERVGEYANFTSHAGNIEIDGGAPSPDGFQCLRLWEEDQAAPLSLGKNSHLNAAKSIFVRSAAPPAEWMAGGDVVMKDDLPRGGHTIISAKGYVVAPYTCMASAPSPSAPRP